MNQNGSHLSIVNNNRRILYGGTISVDEIVSLMDDNWGGVEQM